MKIYDGESEIPIDFLSMVVKTNWGTYMIIYGGESEMSIDVWSMVVKTNQGL